MVRARARAMRSQAALLPPQCFHQEQEGTVENNELDLSASGVANERVNVAHPNGSTPHALCRQVVDNADADLTAEVWGAQLLAGSGAGAVGEQSTEEDRNLAAVLVQFVQRQPLIDDIGHITKVVSERGDGDASNSLLDNPIRLYGTSSEEDVELRGGDLEDVPSLQTLPSLPLLKRSQNSVWYHPKPYKNIDDIRENEQDECLDVDVNGSSLMHNKQQTNKKSLPHKKRISRKLKKNTLHNSQILNGDDLPDSIEHRGIDIIQENVSNNVHTNVEHHNLSTPNIDRALFICQICGEFYVEDQLKFFYHLKQHYEPHNTSIILGTMHHDGSSISMDKIDDSIVVSNEPLPDSLVDLSLDDTISNKSLLYQSQNKLTEYSSGKLLYNNTLKSPIYSTDDKTSLHQTTNKLNFMNTSTVDKLMYACNQCPKSFKRQKQYEAHTKDVHSKVEEMSEFSEPEDLMEGIHVVVGPENEDYLQEDLSSQHSNTIIIQTALENQDHYILPQLTIENGQVVHQQHLNTKEWFVKDSVSTEDIKSDDSNMIIRGNPIEDNNLQEAIEDDTKSESAKSDEIFICPMCGGVLTSRKDYDTHAERCHMQLKEEELQRFMDVEIDVSDTEPGEIAPIVESDNEEESEEIEDVEDEEKSVQKKSTKTVLKCVECGREFKHRNSIIYHMLSHDGTKSFQCEVCEKSFFTASALKVHSRLHSGDKPYKCIECGRKFRQWGDLKYHFISIHSNVKQHQCEYCGKNFARKYSLIIHRRIHTGEKNYRCEFCNKTFRASSYLQNHRKIHTGEKPYPCELCGKRFRMKGDMRRHLKIHSKTQVVDKEKENDKVQNKDNKPLPVRISRSKSLNVSSIQEVSKEEMKVEKEEAQGEIENEDSNGDIKQAVSNEEMISSPSSERALQEDTKLNSNFSSDISGSMYTCWPVFTA